MRTLNLVTNAIGRLLGQPINIAPPQQTQPTKPRPYSGPKFPIPGKPWTVEWIAGKEFLRTPEWRRLAYDTIKAQGRRCKMCGRTPQQHGIAINVDHIKNRRDRPDLALNPNNLQVLCDDHNHGKGNRDSTDFR
jgi:5-methylcytosine-specific restriction protein A